MRKDLTIAVEKACEQFFGHDSWIMMGENFRVAAKADMRKALIAALPYLSREKIASVEAMYAARQALKGEHA